MSRTLTSTSTYVTHTVRVQAQYGFSVPEMSRTLTSTYPPLLQVLFLYKHSMDSVFHGTSLCSQTISSFKRRRGGKNKSKNKNITKIHKICRMEHKMMSLFVKTAVCVPHSSNSQMSAVCVPHSSNSQMSAVCVPHSSNSQMSACVYHIQVTVKCQPVCTTFK